MNEEQVYNLVCCYCDHVHEMLKFSANNIDDTGLCKVYVEKHASR
jgi:hypothetical protein